MNGKQLSDKIAQFIGENAKISDPNNRRESFERQLNEVREPLLKFGIIIRKKCKCK